MKLKKDNSKLLSRMSKIDILVFRISSIGIRYSKPCADCIKIMKLLNCRYIYYSMDTGMLKCEKITNIESCHLTQMSKNLKRY